MKANATPDALTAGQLIVFCHLLTSMPWTGNGFGVGLGVGLGLGLWLALGLGLWLALGLGLWLWLGLAAAATPAAGVGVGDADGLGEGSRLGDALAETSTEEWARRTRSLAGTAAAASADVATMITASNATSEAARGRRRYRWGKEKPLARVADTHVGACALATIPAVRIPGPGAKVPDSAGPIAHDLAARPRFELKWPS